MAVNMQKALEDMRSDLIDEMIRLLNTTGKFPPHRASGALEASLNAAKSTPVVQNNEGQWTFVFKAEKQLVFIDQGRRPGTYSPIEPLVKWIALRGIRIERGTPRGLAFAISKSIFKKGINTINSDLTGPNGRSIIIQPAIQTVINKYIKTDGSELSKASRNEIMDFLNKTLIGVKE